MPQPNRLKPSTSAFTMLRGGWTLITPDKQHTIQPNAEKSWVDIIHNESGEWLGDFPLTPDGFQQMMDTIINPSF